MLYLMNYWMIIRTGRLTTPSLSHLCNIQGTTRWQHQTLRQSDYIFVFPLVLYLTCNILAATTGSLSTPCNPILAIYRVQIEENIRAWYRQILHIMPNGDFRTRIEVIQTGLFCLTIAHQSNKCDCGYIAIVVWPTLSTISVWIT